MSNQPLVSIGLPTYNRASALRRAIESALTQDYQNIELVISDNASTDETQAICLEACARDSRIRYLRQQSNQGATWNFLEVLKQARGEFFMWLGDDDWLDSSYVSLCVRKLIENPDHSLVCGAANYYEDGRLLFEGETIILPQESAQERVATYYQRVTANGSFYGVMRRRQLLGATFPNTLGGDWLLIAAMAFMGKFDVVTSTSVGRTSGGMSKSMKNITASLGISDLHARVPNLSIALSACKDIAWKSSAYDSLSRAARLSLARRVFAVFSRRYFDPYWRSALRPYIGRPFLFAMSLKDRIRTKYLN
jgi:glycosyltransferase involved in cell wall biosynthesis